MLLDPILLRDQIMSLLVAGRDTVRNAYFSFDPHFIVIYRQPAQLLS